MAPRADFLFLMHTGPRPLNRDSYLADLLRRVGVEQGGGTRIAEHWEHGEVSDQEFLAAAVGEWGLPLSNPKRYATRTLTFEDDSGDTGRLLVASAR